MTAEAVVVVVEKHVSGGVNVADGDDGVLLDGELSFGILVAAVDAPC